LKPLHLLDQPQSPVLITGLPRRFRLRDQAVLLGDGGGVLLSHVVDVPLQCRVLVHQPLSLRLQVGDVIPQVGDAIRLPGHRRGNGRRRTRRGDGGGARDEADVELFDVELELHVMLRA